MANASSRTIEVRGMRNSNLSKFEYPVYLPVLCVPQAKYKLVLAEIRQFVLLLHNFNSIKRMQLPDGSVQIEVFLNPNLVVNWPSLPVRKLHRLKLYARNFYFRVVTLTCANWPCEFFLLNILPIPINVGHYSRQGPILFIHLQEHFRIYKGVIAKIFMENMRGLQSVFDKTVEIVNGQYNVKCELLSGRNDCIISVRTNGTRLVFDATQVYWETRLHTDYARLLENIKAGDVLYDVFAGVGEFSLPAARKGCTVMTNDWDTDNYRWLRHNMMRYRHLKYNTYKLNPRAFIKQVIGRNLVKILNNSLNTDGNAHIIMKLPIVTFEFLHDLRGLFNDAGVLKFDWNKINPPFVYTYFYALHKHEQRAKAIALRELREQLKLNLSNDFIEVTYVFALMPKKHVWRLQFRLTKEILLAGNDEMLQTGAVPKTMIATRLAAKRAGAAEAATHGGAPPAKAARRTI